MSTAHSMSLRPQRRAHGDCFLADRRKHLIAPLVVLLLGAGSADLRAATLEQWLNQHEEESPAGQDGDPSLTPFVAATAIPGWAGQPTPLIIAVSPPPSQNGTKPDPVTYVLISHVPPNARISHGQPLGDGTWRVSLDELVELTMTVPADFTGTANLNVTAVSDHGEGRIARHSKTVDIPIRPPAAPAKAAADTTTAVDQSVRTEALAMRRVQPAPRPTEAKPATAVPGPEARPAPAPQKRSAGVPVQKLMQRGDELFAQGDLAGARLYYEMAAADGSDQAALALGKTHDPLIHERLHVHGLSADPDQAATWYRRAMTGGSSEAEGRLKELSAWIAGRAK